MNPRPQNRNEGVEFIRSITVMPPQIAIRKPSYPSD